LCVHRQTYERTEIEKWFAGSHQAKSPLTGLDLGNTNVIPNHNLKKGIERALEAAVRGAGERWRVWVVGLLLLPAAAEEKEEEVAVEVGGRRGRRGLLEAPAGTLVCER
jgi:hypothetical protein